MNFSSESVDSLLTEALEKTREKLVTADRVFFFLQEGREFRVKAAFGGRSKDAILSDKVSRAILRRVRRTGRTLFMSDAMADGGLSPRQSIREIGQRSVICAPLKARDQVVGLVYADTVSMVAAFSPDNLSWMNALVGHLDRHLEPLLPEHLEAIEEEELPEPPQEPLKEGLPAWSPVHRRRPPKPSEGPVVTVLGEKIPNLAARKVKPLGRRRLVRLFKVRPVDRAIFFRSLATMIAAGITIHRAFDVLSEQAGRMGPVAKQLCDDVVNGHLMSAAMKRHPRIFGKVHCSLVTVGEETGNLDSLLESLAQHEERLLALRGRMQAAVAYPALVLLFCLGGCMAAPHLFLNELFATLREANMTFPPLSMAVMTVSEALSSLWFWLVLVGATVGFGYGVQFLRANRPLLIQTERILLRVGTIGPFLQNYAILGFARSLGLLLDAGVRLDRSLELAAEASGSAQLENAMEKVIEELKLGKRFSLCLSNTRLFPHVFIEFIVMGEESGKLVDGCRNAEILFLDKTERALDAVEALMEPLSVAFVGILVGLVAIACLLPLVKMVESFM